MHSSITHTVCHTCVQSLLGNFHTARKENLRSIYSDKHMVLALKLPKSYCKFSPLAATHFLVTKSQEFDVRSRYNFHLISFEYSHYLFAGQFMDIIWRS